MSKKLLMTVKKTPNHGYRKIFGKLTSMIVNFFYTAFRVLLLLVLLLNLTPTRLFTGEVLISRSSFDHDDNLQAETDALLPLFDHMPPVPIYIKDEPILKSGTNTERGVAYTHCDDNELPSIFVKKNFYQKTNRIQLINALKHELTHAWLCRQHQMSGHDIRFRQKFTQVGGWGN